MPLEVLETDYSGVARIGVDGAELRRGDTLRLAFNLMVNALQRDDPLRHSYLQRRWHGRLTSIPSSTQARRQNQGRASVSPVVLSRR
jgi:hypothetical protein